MMRPVLMILSLMVIVVISNPADQVSDDRTFGLNKCPNGCSWVSDFRKSCSNSYATSCTVNANCTSPHGVCNSYSVLKGPAGGTWDSHSGKYCTQSLSTCGISCSDAASKTSCTLL